MPAGSLERVLLGLIGAGIAAASARAALVAKGL